MSEAALAMKERRSAAGEAPVAHWDNPIPGALWLRTWRLGEWLDGPLSPLFASFLAPLLSRAREHAGSRRFGQRLPRMWRAKSPAYCIVNGHFFARAEPRRMSLALLPLRFFASELTGGWSRRWQHSSLPIFLDRIGRARAADLSGCTSQSIFKQLDDLAADVGECWYAIGLASGGAVPLKRFLIKLLRRQFPDIDILVLLRGIGTRSMEAQGELFAFAKSLERPQNGAPSNTASLVASLLAPDAVGGAGDERENAGFAAVMEAVGHQVSTLDFIAPCLGESPADLTMTIDLYRRRAASDPRSAVRRSQSERKRTLACIEADLPEKKRRLFNRLYSSLCDHESALENTTFEMQRAWPEFRRRFLELGRRMRDAGSIAEPQDVFFLHYDEIRDGLRKGPAATLAALVEERRATLAIQARMDPPRCLPPAGDPAWDKAPAWPVNLRALCRDEAGDQWLLSGIAASPGRRSGIARVCPSLAAAARLQPGDILVVAKATPEWTPLFATAAAFVADVGAATSHSSIVAREFGIPAVVGTQRATHAIRDGDLVTVDGSAGTVQIGAGELSAV
jgi:rifampicin phosphotransferase